MHSSQKPTARTESTRDPRYATLAIKIGLGPLVSLLARTFYRAHPSGGHLVASQSFSPSSQGKVDLTGYRAGSHF
jgi:hypothetical protein